MESQSTRPKLKFVWAIGDFQVEIYHEQERLVKQHLSGKTKPVAGEVTKAKQVLRQGASAQRALARFDKGLKELSSMTDPPDNAPHRSP